MPAGQACRQVGEEGEGVAGRPTGRGGSRGERQCSHRGGVGRGRESREQAGR